MQIVINKLSGERGVGSAQARRSKLARLKVVAIESVGRVGRGVSTPCPTKEGSDAALVNVARARGPDWAVDTCMLVLVGVGVVEVLGTRALAADGPIDGLGRSAVLVADKAGPRPQARFLTATVLVEPRLARNTHARMVCIAMFTQITRVAAQRSTFFWRSLAKLAAETL